MKKIFIYFLVMFVNPAHYIHDHDLSLAVKHDLFICEMCIGTSWAVENLL